MNQVNLDVAECLMYEAEHNERSRQVLLRNCLPDMIAELREYRRRARFQYTQTLDTEN